MVGGKEVRCYPGHAVITGPNNYGLHVPYAIHAVGPVYSKYKGREEKADKILRSAYVDTMRRAFENDLETVAFSLLCCGSYRGENRTPQQLIKIAIEAVMSNTYSGLKEVHFCGCHSDEFYSLIEVGYSMGLRRQDL